MKHLAKTAHADWLRGMTMQQASDLIDKSKANDEISKSNKRYRDVIASHRQSQFFSELTVPSSVRVAWKALLASNRRSVTLYAARMHAIILMVVW